WYTGALFLLGLVLVLLLAGGAFSASRAVLTAVGSLGAFAVWCAVSIAWSSDRGIAWDGANRTLVYLLVYALFACLPWRRESIPVLLGFFSAAVLGIGVVDLLRSVGDIGTFFINGRLAAPAGYPNAACALFMLAFWPVAY